MIIVFKPKPDGGKERVIYEGSLKVGPGQTSNMMGHVLLPHVYRGED